MISARVAGIMEKIENGVNSILSETTELGSLDDHIRKLYAEKEHAANSNYFTKS